MRAFDPPRRKGAAWTIQLWTLANGGRQTAGIVRRLTRAAALIVARRWRDAAIYAAKEAA